jgi:hypothetical protein
LVGKRRSIVKGIRITLQFRLESGIKDASWQKLKNVLQPIPKNWAWGQVLLDD